MLKLLSFFVLLNFSISANAKLVKINEHGHTLPASTTIWACVLDTNTKLMWEVKTLDNSLHNTKHTYTWYQDKQGINNGEYSHNCNWYDFCNTDLYVDINNRSLFCGHKNWRLPTHNELKNLQVFGEQDPTINTNYFPNTQPKTYWSSTLDTKDKELVLDVPFFYGGYTGSEKQFDAHIRLVRDNLDTNTNTNPATNTLKINKPQE